MTVLKSRPSIDDRFAVGYCACQPQPVVTNPRKKRADRPVVQLIRRDLFVGVARPRSAADRRREEKRALNGSELW